MKKKAKYGAGTGNTGVVKNYMTSPSEVLAENHINMREAQADAYSNPLTIGMQTLGQLGMQYGISQGGFNNIEGINGADGQGAGGDIANTALMALSKFGYGGQVGSEPIEVEGGEVIHSPDGQVVETQGPSHEEGGMDMMVPFGSNIFAGDNLKRDGQTMAERKLAREKKAEKLLKLMDKHAPGDTVLKNTSKRVETTNGLEEDEDLQIQEAVRNMAEQVTGVAGQKKTAALGITNPLFELLEKMQSGEIAIPDFASMDGSSNDWHNPKTTTVKQEFGTLGTEKPAAATPSFNPQIDPSIFGDDAMYSDAETGDVMNPLPTVDNTKKGHMTGGDILGLIGNQVSTFGPLINTLNSRATDKPNENYYEGFGEDALAANDQMKGFAGDQHNEMLRLLEKRNVGAKRSGRAGARGINTQRAMDLATDQNTNDATQQAYANFAQQMSGILGQQSQLENQQDHVVMRGEEGRGLRDIEDKDAHYTNMAANIVGMGEGIQQTAKDLNQAEQNKIMMAMLQQLSKYGITIDNKNQLQ